MQGEALLKCGLETIGDKIVDALQKEFVAQGHSNTGNALQSIVYAVQQLSNGLQLNITFSKYLLYVDGGVKPAKVPFQIGSGARTSKYIKALTAWVIQRNIVSSQKQAKQIAFAIARTHKKEGIPGLGGFAFSGNGRRTGFLSKNKILGQVPAMVEEMIADWALRTAEEILFS